MKRAIKIICCALIMCMALASAAALADGEALAPDGGALIPIDEYPIVDGSTATLPLSYALMQAFTGCSAEDAEDAIRHNTTNLAFYYLADGGADILLVYEPSAESFEYMDENGVEYEMEPIGRDALVFLVNSQNPVTNLSQDDITAIYTGKKTDWSEVEGGVAMPITPYQRPDASGSQVMMYNLAVPKDKIMEAPQTLVLSEMYDLIEAMADYDNAADALGYSVWFYAANMYAMDEVRILSVDGIEPSAAAIEDGSYPYVQPFYAVLRKDAPEGSAQRRIYDFLATPEGQRLVRECGYAGAGEAEQEVGE